MVKVDTPPAARGGPGWGWGWREEGRGGEPAGALEVVEDSEVVAAGVPADAAVASAGESVGGRGGVLLVRLLLLLPAEEEAPDSSPLD